jgi:uncharacterized cofD-like protein
MDRPTRAPGRIVTIGGGTGLPAVLRGLRPYVTSGESTDLTAVVTVTDDGGSSGRLRRSMGLPPPGDIRNCLVALSEEEELLAGLFQHRYGASNELEGHSVGNLILAALAEQTGCFLKAVELSSRVLRTAGRILPATQANVGLEALLADGSAIVGETSINRCGQAIRRVVIRPADPAPTPGVLEAIAQADLVAIGPGSLHTSVLPNLLVSGVACALAETDAVVVLIANLVREQSEAVGLDLIEHVAVIEDHAGAPILDAVLVHDGPLDPAVVARYRDEGAIPLAWPTDGPTRPLIVRRNLVGPGVKLRHDPRETARALIETWAVLDRARDRSTAARVGDEHA